MHARICECALLPLRLIILKFSIDYKNKVLFWTNQRKTTNISHISMNNQVGIEQFFVRISWEISDFS